MVRLARVRVIVPTGGGQGRSLIQFIRKLQAEDRRVVFVSADRPYTSILQSLQAEGVDADAMHFIDAVSSMNGAAPTIRPSNVTFLPSPTMLEMLAMRIEQVAQRIGGAAHVVVDSLDTLSLYNGAQPVQEFSHYLANRLRSHGVPGDFVLRDGPASRALLELVVSFCDDRIELTAKETA